MKKILVIDDERDVLEIVRTVLKSKGYTIRCAEGGEEGLRQAEADRPDLIICDLMMPRVSGMEVVKRLKAHPLLKTVPVMILSAVGSDSDRPDDYWARGLGVDEYISKPFDPLDLLGRVEYIFRRASYASSKLAEQESAGVSPDTRSRAAATAPAEDLSTMSPADVARRYVECWNTRDWTTEYNLMADDFMGAVKLNDYVAARNNAYAADNGPNLRMSITNILEEKVSTNVAKIVAEREDMVGGRQRMKKATYTLKKTFKGWKIIKYTDEPIRRTVPTETEE